MPTYKLNFKTSPADNRDYTIKFKVSDSKQSNIDLSRYCSSVKNQGDVGACTAFASVGLLEFLYNKNEKKVNDLLSERFLYYTTRVDIEKTSPNEDNGAYLRDTLQAMVKYGVSTENAFPYNEQYNEKPDKKIYDEALNYQVATYASIKGTGKNLLNNIKVLLQNGSGFVAGITCFQNFFKNKKGVIPLPYGKVIGGHAVLFIGYNDKTSLLKFKNSWGENWGDKGYGYLPYAYVLSNLVSDLWTVNSAEYQNEVFDITIPKKRLRSFNNRLTFILDSLKEPNNLDTIISEIIKNDMDLSENDINELIIIARRFSENITMVKNKLFT